MTSNVPRLLALCALASLSLSQASAQTWLPATGANSWNAGGNWTPASFPNAIDATANVNNQITGASTVNLNTGITVGTLNLGDVDGTSAFTIATGTGTNVLTFDVTSGAAALNSVGTGTSTDVISAGMLLNDNLNIAFGTHALSTSGAINAGAKTITTTSGTSSASLIWTMSGDLVGNGRLVLNSQGTTSVTGVKSFTGVVEVNGKGSGSNTGTLTLTSGSLGSASEFIINGAISANTTQAGGVATAGNGASQATNPGQRFTANTITLNSGTLQDQGQTATVGTLNNWQKGLEIVQDNVATLKANSGYSVITSTSSTSTAGTLLNITNLTRGNGGTIFIRGNALGVAIGAFGNTGDQIVAANASSIAIGGGGAEGTPTISIIPWMVGANTGSATPSGFVVNSTNGLRALGAGETANTFSSATVNYSNNTLVMAANNTVNSLTMFATTGQRIASSNDGVGVGKTLTVTSGGVYLSAANGSIGVSGAANNGTLNFGSAEGVVWNIGTNTNTIASSITGSGGFTKAGTGTLVLTGANLYTGLTVVSGGTLQVGDGINASTLGAGNLEVANGATLSLFNSSAISDSAAVTLDAFGLLNGKINLGFTGSETVGTLYFGSLAQAVGTWGATGSGATNINDIFFTGTGVLNVTAVPEPTIYALTFMGIFTLVVGRRRRSRE